MKMKVLSARYERGAEGKGVLYSSYILCIQYCRMPRIVLLSVNYRYYETESTLHEASSSPPPHTHCYYKPLTLNNRPLIGWQDHQHIKSETSRPPVPPTPFTLSLDPLCLLCSFSGTVGGHISSSGHLNNSFSAHLGGFI